MNEKDTGGNFCCEANSAPEERRGETRWSRRDKEGQQGELYGYGSPPPLDKETLADIWEILIEEFYRQQRQEAIEQGADPREFPEDPVGLDIFYYHVEAKRYLETIEQEDQQEQ